MRKALPWLILFWVVLLGCASSHELRATAQILDSKISALERDVTASRDGVADTRDRLDKLEDSVKAIQRFQADTGADMTALRAEIQRLRGATEETQESLKTVKGEAASENQASKLEELRLRMQYMEDFLGIGRPGGTADKAKEASEAAAGPPPAKPDREKAYNDAYEAFKAGRYADARKRFEEFLAEHGKSEYGDNARFWIGECYYFEKDYERAILEYEKVITEYPRGNKVPNALLKQGLAFLELGDKNSGRLLLEKVIREHPNTSPARIAKIKLSSIN
ncbi:MAG TPA: tol-pal system protein YbgF [Syntrophales bacterium]|nr:tol-pal system protein YbgF [Syntrophales bacterium]